MAVGHLLLAGTVLAASGQGGGDLAEGAGDAERGGGVGGGHLVALDRRGGLATSSMAPPRSVSTGTSPVDAGRLDLEGHRPLGPLVEDRVEGGGVDDQPGEQGQPGQQGEHHPEGAVERRRTRRPCGAPPPCPTSLSTSKPTAPTTAPGHERPPPGPAIAEDPERPEEEGQLEGQPERAPARSEVTARGTASGVGVEQGPGRRGPPTKVSAAAEDPQHAVARALIPLTLRCHGVRTASAIAAVTPRPLHSRPGSPTIEAVRRLCSALAMVSRHGRGRPAPVSPSSSMMSPVTSGSPAARNPTTVAMTTRIRGNRDDEEHAGWPTRRPGPPLVSPTFSCTSSSVPSHGHRSARARRRSMRRTLPTAPVRHPPPSRRRPGAVGRRSDARRRERPSVACPRCRAGVYLRG